MTTPEEVIRRVAKRTGVSVSAMRAPSSTPGSREAKVAHARQRAMWALRQLKRPDGSWRFSQPWISNYFGGRLHNAVAHAEKVHPARRHEDHGQWRGRSRDG